MVNFEIKDGVAIIPAGTSEIPDRVFYDCSSLTSVVIPESVKIIGSFAFEACSSLASITIPNSVTSIGKYAFAGCSSLTSITIPNSVTSIGKRALSGCSSLESIVVDSGNTVYDSRDNAHAIIETASNTLVVGCQNTTIPNTVTRIEDYAFLNCPGLTSITIPQSVTSIGVSTFEGCKSLNSITFQGPIAQWKEIEFGEDWNYHIPTKVVHCTDGDHAWNDANPTNEIDEQFTESFTISKMKIHYWTEVSGIIEHYYFKKHNGYPIPNTIASNILQVSDNLITLSKKDMFHYDRVIGQDGEKFTKMICGLKSEEIFQEVLSDFEDNYDFMKEVNKMVNESKETKYSVRQAIYIIENLYRMHEEDGLNELIPKWHDALRDSVEVLNSTKEKTQTISDYIEYGNYLLSDTQILTLNVIDLNYDIEHK